MIIRRMADAIREQNWFTVFIEFALVVTGVLVALQFDNWNNARKFDERERELLVQLRGEVLANNQRLEHQIVFIKTAIEAGVRGLKFLEQDTPCTDNCQSLLVDFFHASQAWGTPPYIGVYSEMRQLGLPRSVEIKASVDAYYVVFSGTAAAQGLISDYRIKVRNRIPVNDIGMLWQLCHHIIKGDVEVLEKNCASKLGNVNANVLEYIRATPSIYDDLNGWLGQNTHTLQQLPKQKDRGVLALTAIDAELERMK